jgi:hypothetical protein
MHIPLIIAILALLAFALLPVLVRCANAEDIGAKGVRAHVARIARWASE